MRSLGFAFEWGDMQGETPDVGRHPLVLHHVDVLFGHSSHSLFSYHQDVDSHMTAILQLSPTGCLSDFHIAGADSAAEYTGAGSCHIFPSALWHRSGKSTIGTVKIAFFFFLMKQPAKVDLTASVEGNRSSDVPCAQTIKPEKLDDAYEEDTND